MTDEIQKTAEDPRRASLAKARAVRAAKRTEAATKTLQEDGYEVMQAAQSISNDTTPSAAARTPMRSSTGRAEVIGRSGEKLSRSHKLSQDQFEIPPNMIPAGWSYQWNTVTVVGNGDIARDQMQLMYNSGWRPVPAERHAGVLVPSNAKGDIIRGGLRLEERPEILSQEARDEDLRLAKQLISDRNESLKLSGVRKGMADGFEMGQKYRGTGGEIRMSIDRSLDVQQTQPKHTLAEPGE